MASLKNEELPKQFETQLHNAGFKHVFFITCDHSWTNIGDIVNIIWLPAIPLESMDAGVKKINSRRSITASGSDAFDQMGTDLTISFNKCSHSPAFHRMLY
ncbi:YpiF family protein [Lysinibacillus sp. MHQ-1]|nr:YpiF family protein [Lysinibacillus sp. MHQ-1]